MIVKFPDGKVIDLAQSPVYSGDGAGNLNFAGYGGTTTYAGTASEERHFLAAIEKAQKAGTTYLVLESETASSLATVSPTGGTVDGGTEVLLTGNGLRPSGVVTFGGVQAVSVEYLDKGRLLVVTPAHAAAAVDVNYADVRGDAVPQLPGGFTYS